MNNDDKRIDFHPHQNSAKGRVWYPLDNSAKIFPAIKTGKVSAVFRLSVILKEPIDPEVLQQALLDVLPRFPNFAMKLKPGVFWYYLEPNPARPLAYADTRYPCRRLYRKNNLGFLFRVLYFDNRISLEVFHSLTDGTGGLTFIKTLTARYLTLKTGEVIPSQEGVLDIMKTPPEAEMEDSYKKYARMTRLRSPAQPRAFHISGTLEPSGRINIITAKIPLDQIKKLAIDLHVTLNDLLVALYIDAFCQIQLASERQLSRPVAIAVPINMRRFYPSPTLRNFFLRVTPTVNQAYGEFSFKEILAEVHHYMMIRTNEKYLNAQMFSNLRNERLLAARLIPLLLKNRILKLAYLYYGDSRTTSTLTNIGAVRFPEAMQRHVSGVEVLMGPSLSDWINCGAVSFENTLTLTFSRRISEPLVERLFCTHLVQLGIPVHVSSNHYPVYSIIHPD